MRKLIRSYGPLPTTIVRIEDGYKVDGETGEKVHRIIYHETHGLVPLGYHIHHIDGCKLNNAIENLIAIPGNFHTYIHRKFSIKELPKRENLDVELKHWERLIDEYEKTARRLASLEASLYGNIGRHKAQPSKKQKRIHWYPKKRHATHPYAKR